MADKEETSVFDIQNDLKGILHYDETQHKIIFKPKENNFKRHYNKIACYSYIPDILTSLPKTLRICFFTSDQRQHFIKKEFKPKGKCFNVEEILDIIIQTEYGIWESQGGKYKDFTIQGIICIDQNKNHYQTCSDRDEELGSVNNELFNIILGRLI
jgi:hypothetical protein